MILQALVSHYEDLAQRGEIAPPGWGNVKVSYALCIGEDGALQDVVCLKNEQTRGKKTAMVPQEIQLPAPVKRSVGIVANFLCDNSSYLLGIDNKGKPQRSRDCFAAARELHRQLLVDVDSPAAKTVLAFFDNWQPERAAEHSALQDVLEDVMDGSNLVFRCASGFVHEDPQICKAWNSYYAGAGDGPEMVCLVTGKKGPAENIHPSIKGVSGAQSSGAALVSFNAPAFCSYGKEQNLNAPVGQYAAFAYTTALNHLLSDRERVYHMGDTTVVCWAKGGESAYQDLMGGWTFDAPATLDTNELHSLVSALCQGQKVEFEEAELDPDNEFYILGLSPNAARLSVRFFLRSSFGGFLQNVEAHHERMRIVRPAFDKFETLPLWKLLDETVNQNSRNKAAAPNLAGETLRAILNDTPYPAQLLQGVRLRIRAEQNITRGRAAIIRAYYTKNRNYQVPEEVLTVSLNPDSTNVPYTLGRLFSVLENIQAAASNNSLNTTIKDRYFNAASATPAHVFPTLVNLAQKHMKKMDGGLAAYYDKQLADLMGKLTESYPAHLSIPQQGAFQLGYYHQTQERYTSKKNKEEN